MLRTCGVPRAALVALLALIATHVPAGAAGKAPTIDLEAESDSGISSIDNVTNVTSPKLRGTASPGSVVVIYSGAERLAEAKASASGQWAKRVTFEAKGVRSYSLTADVKGVRSSPLQITVDTTTPPAVSIEIDSSSADKFGNVDAVTFDGELGIYASSEVDAGLVIEANGIEVDFLRRRELIWPGAGQVTLPGGLSSVRARNYSKAGNLSAPSNALTVMATVEPERLDLSRLAVGDGVRLGGDRRDGRLGGRVAPAGDFNGDGFDDVIIGSGSRKSWWSDATETAHVVFGAKSAAPSQWSFSRIVESRGVELICPEEPSRGPPVIRPSAAGDLNGDGIEDLVVACFYKVVMDVKVSIYVIYGRHRMPTSGILDLATVTAVDGFRVVTPDIQFSYLGTQRLGDVDGDSRDDLGIMVSGLNPAILFIVRGTNDTTRTDVSITQADGPDGFRIKTSKAIFANAIALSALGDINGDEINDFGYIDTFAGSTESGELYVLFGTRGRFPGLGELNGERGFVVFNKDISSSIGRGLEALGDINKDGLDDFAIIANYDPPVIVYGRKRGFPARTPITEAASLGTTLLHGGAAESFPVGLGDFNGDGRGDVIFPSMRTNDVASGEVVSDYIAFGRKANKFGMIPVPGLSSADGLRLDLAEATGGQEHLVSAAGDFNGDGFADVLMGAPEAGTDGKRRIGSVFVVFGGRSER